jgi:hypothetical protein
MFLRLNYLLITEFNISENYVLIFQTKINNNNLFKLIYLNKNSHIKKFFMDKYHKTEPQYKFFNFIEKIFHTNLSKCVMKILINGLVNKIF